VNPGHAATYYKLADAYSRIQKFDAAERLLQRSDLARRYSTGPYILMGKVLEKKGEPELAVRALQHALAMDPNNSVTHHLLGQAYQGHGRIEDARTRTETCAGNFRTSRTPSPESQASFIQVKGGETLCNRQKMECLSDPRICGIPMVPV